MVDVLGRLVSIESPSDDPPSLDRFASVLEELFLPHNRLVRFQPEDPQRGRHMRVYVEGADADAAHAVALCHYDTVWSLGTLERIPFNVDADGVARGPGCF